MKKIKLAICMRDLEYQTRFVNCFMNHYKHLYELHVFTSLDQLILAKPMEYTVIITGEYSTEEMTNFVERGEILLNLMEDYQGEDSTDFPENFNCNEKYQEVYKIAEKLECLIANQESRNDVTLRATRYQKTGVYSLSQELYQVPFSALLGKLYSENQKVLILDLQTYSGMDDKTATMGLEDLLSVTTTGNYSKGRMLECIRHEPQFDYISPVNNSQCIVEGTQELYENLMDILAKEFGYERIIINFGTAFWGQLDMMEKCQEVYILSANEARGCWREEAFFQELRHLEKEGLLELIKKISIPLVPTNEMTWSTLVEKWSWGNLGELLRHMLEKENAYGTAV